MWIPDGPWSDVMLFLLMNKEGLRREKRNRTLQKR